MSLYPSLDFTDHNDDDHNSRKESEPLLSRDENGSQNARNEGGDVAIVPLLSNESSLPSAAMRQGFNIQQQPSSSASYQSFHVAQPVSHRANQQLLPTQQSATQRQSYHCNIPTNVSLSDQDLSTAQHFIRETQWTPNDKRDSKVILLDAHQKKRFQPISVDEKKGVNVLGDSPPCFDESLQRAYRMHTLTSSDSLRRLTLLYCTTEDEIKLLNGKFASSDVHLWELSEVKVPIVDNPRRHVMIQAQQDELNQEEKSVSERSRFIMAAAYFMTMRVNATKDEAAYYILLHEGHTLKALEEYDLDVKWERNHLQDFNRMKKRAKQQSQSNQTGLIRKLKGLMTVACSGE